jgi:hypothetical protein
MAGVVATEGTFAPRIAAGVSSAPLRTAGAGWRRDWHIRGRRADGGRRSSHRIHDDSHDVVSVVEPAAGDSDDAGLLPRWRRRAAAGRESTSMHKMASGALIEAAACSPLPRRMPGRTGRIGCGSLCSSSSLRSVNSTSCRPDSAYSPAARRPASAQPRWPPGFSRSSAAVRPQARSARREA